jgi:hypothetical protein
MLVCGGFRRLHRSNPPQKQQPFSASLAMINLFIRDPSAIIQESMVCMESQNYGAGPPRDLPRTVNAPVIRCVVSVF